jgi:hypothetical protein
MNAMRLGVVLLVGALTGCATLSPQIAKSSADYLSVGVASDRLKGNTFYLVVGEVDLYRLKAGTPVPTGRTAEAAVAVQADKETGLVQRLVTLQPAGRRASRLLNAAAVTGGVGYTPGDLVGGISAIDVQPQTTWLKALDAMRNAANLIAASATAPNVVITGPIFPPPPYWHQHHRGWDRFRHDRDRL